MNQPTLKEYSDKVTSLDLTIERQIILIQVYKMTLMGMPVHQNMLINLTGLKWKEFSAIMNGLVLRGALERIEKQYYITKIN
jgi:hypothetical protein